LLELIGVIRMKRKRNLLTKSKKKVLLATFQISGRIFGNLSLILNCLLSNQKITRFKLHYFPFHKKI
jgi:hypothetical protein